MNTFLRVVAYVFAMHAVCALSVAAIYYALRYPPPKDKALQSDASDANVSARKKRS
jgi:hypothetical protein